MSKVVIYTALFTDNIEEVFGTLPEYDIDNIDFICFTNTPYLKSDTWKINVVDLEGNGRLTARKYKMLPHNYLPEYDGWIWMDNSCLFNFDPIDLYNYYIDGVDIAVHEHCDRTNIFQEAELLISRGHDKDIITKQISDYRNKGYQDQGLYETGILMRKNNEKVIAFNMLWWSEINSKSVRDQLSFSYIKWKLKEVKINGIKETFVAHNHQLGKKQSEHFYTVPRYKVKLI